MVPIRAVGTWPKRITEYATNLWSPQIPKEYDVTEVGNPKTDSGLISLTGINMSESIRRTDGR